MANKLIRKRERHGAVVTELRALAGDLWTRPVQPIIGLLHDGERSYLWVGNNAEGDMGCFCTFADVAAMREFAKDILKELGTRTRKGGHK